MVAGILPTVKYLGLIHIPAEGPFLVTLNHYSREGFFIAWAAAAITVVMPRDPIWMMTSAWTNRRGGLDSIRTTLTKRIFLRLAEVYGFVTTPPMPPAEDELMERMVSIRKLMGLLKNQPEPILCIAPEGMDFPGGNLAIPYPGSGKLILQLGQILKRVLPVGVYEKEGKLHVRFGKTYSLLDEKFADDFLVRKTVMERIADLLPVSLNQIQNLY